MMAEPDSAEIPPEQGQFMDSSSTLETSLGPDPSVRVDHDVLTRLDSLLSNNGEDSTGSQPSSSEGDILAQTRKVESCVTTPQGILKKIGCVHPCQNRSTRRIRFPDQEEIQEVIGYGGHYDSSSDEDEAEVEAGERRNRFLEFTERDEETSVEDKNVLNMTRRNTAFNSYAPNLLVPNAATHQQGLGMTRPTSPPLVTVQSFKKDHQPGKLECCTTNRMSSNVYSSKLPMKGKEDKPSDDEESHNSEESGMSDPTDVSDTDNHNESNGSTSPIFSDICSDHSVSDGVIASIDDVTDDSDSCSDNVLITLSAAEDENKMENKLVEEEVVHHQPKQTTSSARATFLLTTVECFDKGSESESTSDAVVEHRPKVKITRKSPYVAGTSSTSGAILKGTPKPSVSIRKPPIPKDKPKVPVRPDKRPGCKYPAAAPRNNSFKCDNSEPKDPSQSNQVTISDDSHIEVCQTNRGILFAAECYTAFSDVQNALIMDVTAEKVSNSGQVTISSTSHEINPEELPDEKTNEEEDDSEGKKATKKVEKSLSGTSSNFEQARATIANALEFNRHDKVARPSTKRQAPKPPVLTEVPIDQVRDFPEAPNKELPPEPIPTPPPAPPMPKSALASAAGRQSSIKSSEVSGASPKNRVQFHPETTTVTIPPTEDRSIQPISYNRWINRPGEVLESSFTGQMITKSALLQSPSVGGGGGGGGQPQHPKRSVPVTYTPMPQEDEVRRWTEKKHKQRSKSLPRGSEIDEFMGSSKNSKSVLRPFLNTSSSSSSVLGSSPVRRQSRTELFESDHRQLQSHQGQHRKTKFSIMKFFKINIASNPYGIQFADKPLAHNSHFNAANTNLLDKEHEREILERERARMRPEIIHPLDLQSAGVEVVKITPRGHVYEKNQRTSQVAKSALIKTKGKLDYSDSKDSGHETSSIHTENSEASSSPSATSSSGMTLTTSATKSGLNDDDDTRDSSPGRARPTGFRVKPIPPPRSHSLETFGPKCLRVVEDMSTNDDSASGTSTSQDNSESSTAEDGPRRAMRFESPHQDLHPSLSSASSDGLPPHAAYIQPGKMKIGATSVPAINTIHLQSFGQTNGTGSTKSPAMRGETGRSESFTYGRTFPPLQLVNLGEFCGSEGSLDRESASPPLNVQRDTDFEHEDQSLTADGMSGQTGKIRNVVYNNLEDNYGAVISANHEALAQILEQSSLRRPSLDKNSCPELTSAKSLKLVDFTRLEEVPPVETFAGVFVSATYQPLQMPVKLLLNTKKAFEQTQQNAFTLCPVNSFVDKIDLDSFLCKKNGNASLEGASVVYVSVFKEMQVENLSSFVIDFSDNKKLQQVEKEVCFILLQIVNALKFLQAQGIEKVNPTLDHFILVKSTNDVNFRIIIVDRENVASNGSSFDEDNQMSLPCAALSALMQLLGLQNPVRRASTLMSDIQALKDMTTTELSGMFMTMAETLQRGSSVALDQAKSMLEYMLWWPDDLNLTQPRKQGLQHWLDLERASVLNNLIRTRGLWNIELDIFEEYHLLFLVQTCAKMMLESSLMFKKDDSPLKS